MYSLIRPVLFRLDPERAHHITLKLLALPIAPLLSALFNLDDSRLAVSAFGLDFRNPVGLAAGYDKNGQALRGLAALGFGHVEAGTVTRAAQPGNPRPRIFRLPADEALINRMGFPNDGVDNLVRGSAKGLSVYSQTASVGAGLRPAPTDLRMGAKLPHAKIGINIGKSKDTPLERAADDYGALLRQVAPIADYVAINVSSPNTPGLRQLQTKTFIDELLREIAAVRASLDAPLKARPVLLKIAPDLSWPEIDDILAAALTHDFDGVIAANTTVSREGLRTPAPVRDETGGLSGQPLRARSTEIIRYIYRHTQGRLPIVGVGGIDSAEAALEKIRAGATLVQVYTGLIYRGPGLVKEIKAGLLRAGVRSISEVVGVDAAGDGR